MTSELFKKKATICEAFAQLIQVARYKYCVVQSVVNRKA